MSGIKERLRERTADYVENICSRPTDYEALEAADEIERLERELAEARRTAEYWKAEHLAGNAMIERLERELAEAEQSRAINHASAKIALDQRDALRAEAEALRKESARMDYVRKVFLLDDEEAMFDLFIAETVAEFNATIDGVLATRSPAVDAAIAKEKP